MVPRPQIFPPRRSARPADDPEVTKLTFSFLPLSDAAPIIVAHAQGWFREHGITSTLRRETSWTAVRDALNAGTAHAAQMLFGMPVAAACGLLGNDQPPLVVPWVLSRNGQGITLNRKYLGAAGDDARALRSAAIAGRNRGRPLVFGHTLRVGTHAMWLRYWLAAGGIDPDHDVALITVPPPQMVANMRTARMDGFCVGEPWNARALAEELGFTAITSQEIWPDHPEKVCAFTARFAQENPHTVVAALKALHTAGQWLDDPAHHDEAAALLAQPEYLNCDVAWVRARLGADFAYGDGRTSHLPHAMTFAQPSANRPRESHAVWFLTQLRRWGLLFGEPDYAAIAGRVIRADLYERAIDELGISDPAPIDGPETLFDGRVFDPESPADYVRNFECKHLNG
jgi:nitrate/nitrite transport system substrate-binding protein